MILRSPAGRPPPGGALRPNVALLGDDVILWSAEQRRVLWADGREVHATGEGSLTAVDQLALGAAARWSRVANAGVDFGTVQPLASDAGVTMLVIAAPSASTNRKALFSQRLGTGSVANYTLYANATGTVGISAGTMTLYCRNTAAAGCPVTVTSAGIDGDPHCWVFANSTAASSGYALRDGADLTVTTNTALTGTFVTSAQAVRVGNPASHTADGLYVMDEPVYLVLAWPRYILREEMRELSRLLFAEPSLAYEQVAVEGMVATGGGAHSLTGSLSAQSASITGSLARSHLHSLAGDLAAQSASLAGDLNLVLPLHSLTGVLVADAASLAGALHRYRKFSLAGSLSASPASLVGDLVHTGPGLFTLEGALAAQPATLAGSLRRLGKHTLTGVLDAGPATLSGTLRNASAPVNVPLPGGSLGWDPRKPRSMRIQGLREDLEKALEDLGAPPNAAPAASPSLPPKAQQAALRADAALVKLTRARAADTAALASFHSALAELQRLAAARQRRRRLQQRALLLDW